MFVPVVDFRLVFRVVWRVVRALSRYAFTRLSGIVSYCRRNAISAVVVRISEVESVRVVSAPVVSLVVLKDWFSVVSIAALFTDASDADVSDADASEDDASVADASVADV